MTTENLQSEFGGDLMFYAARGFIDGMSRSQRDVFQSLFSSGKAAAVAAICLEQASFKLGHDESPDPYAPLFAALEYALPRMSTAGWTVATEIKRLWDTLPEPTRMLLRAKIDTAIRNGRSGASVDTAHWARIARLPIDEAERGELTAF
ncbi:hypothetical protein HFN89_00885 [Rhizobium laguerreae]|nr:hypothetical protein [Rhizobium laguerreae]